MFHHAISSSVPSGAIENWRIVFCRQHFLPSHAHVSALSCQSGSVKYADYLSHQWTIVCPCVVLLSDTEEKEGKGLIRWPIHKASRIKEVLVAYPACSVRFVVWSLFGTTHKNVPVYGHPSYLQRTMIFLMRRSMTSSPKSGKDTTLRTT